MTGQARDEEDNTTNRASWRNKIISYTGDPRWRDKPGMKKTTQQTGQNGGIRYTAIQATPDNGTSQGRKRRRRMIIFIQQLAKSYHHKNTHNYANSLPVSAPSTFRVPPQLRNRGRSSTWTTVWLCLRSVWQQGPGPHTERGPPPTSVVRVQVRRLCRRRWSLCRWGSSRGMSLIPCNILRHTKRTFSREEYDVVCQRMK